MLESEGLAVRFEENRSHLRGVAYRMLGSLAEAEDAVQETWLRLRRADTGGVENLTGWLTTVVGRFCLDALRSRRSRREESLDGQAADPPAGRRDRADPEAEAVLADSVGLALLVVLDRLGPAERIAFVLHDLFDLPFDEIAPIVGRTPAAARQLASRARRRVRGTAVVPDRDLAGHRDIVESFLWALRSGDVERLVAVLDPDLVVRADIAGTAPDAPREIRGARNWASQAVQYSRGARYASLALVDGKVGLVLAPRGRLLRALQFALAGGKIVEIEVVADPERLRRLKLAVLEG